MNSNEENRSIINSLEELCGDDDKFYIVPHVQQEPHGHHDNQEYSIYYQNLYSNTTTTMQSSVSSTKSTNYGFNLNLSSLNLEHSSPRRDIDDPPNTSPFNSHVSPRRPDNYPMSDRTKVEPLYDQRGHLQQRPRREAEGYYSPRELNPRDIIQRREPENYDPDPHLRGQDSVQPYYSPRERRGSENGYSTAPSLSRRDNEPTYSKDYSREHNYYSPRDPQVPKPSPREAYYADRPISRESDSYYASCEPTPRDHNYRRDSSDSVYYHSPREVIPSPRTNEPYYATSRELTPREQLIKNSSDSFPPPDKSLPNPYAAPFIPNAAQRSIPSNSYGQAMSYNPPYLTPNMRPQSQPIAYDYLQRPGNHFSGAPENIGRSGQYLSLRNQYDSVPQLQHYPADQVSHQSGTSQRPSKVPPLSFSGLSSAEYTSGYYSPKYGQTNVQRSYSNQQLRGIASPITNRPNPLHKSNSEKVFDLRRGQTSYTPRTNFARPTHISSTGNLSGRGKFAGEEEKSQYYQVTPNQQPFNVPPLPIFPLKILSLDVNGSFNATDESYTSARNAFFDYIEQTKAQVILMYNTGLENEDQLKIVRNEVKAKYHTESAMWASFKSPGPDGGRGVGVLVLGPLAPRTGWIVSDSCGHILSASSRVKPGLPVLCFIACDCQIPPLEPTPFESLHAELPLPSPPGEQERKNKVHEKLNEIISAEQEKGVFVFAAGKIILTEDESDECKFKENGVVRIPVTRTPDDSSMTDVDDVLATHQPFGDGPRPPDGTGMKVLSTEALPARVASPHLPTLIQIAVYGWPSETFVFSEKPDTPLGSGRKSRRNKSGRKKDELSPQLQQATINSPRPPSDSSPGYSYHSSYIPPPPPTNLHDSPFSLHNASPRLDLPSWGAKVNEFKTRLNDILNSTAWGVVRLDQMKYMVHELFLWVERFSKIEAPGFPTSKSVETLQEIYAYGADQFLKVAPDMILQLLHNWSVLVDEILNSEPK